ncbi:MAG: FAD-binding protein, partial [Frankiales bacterium]|nr:FAD-binding protein [Frankiales bacterium]
MATRHAVIIGSGLTGATTARILLDAGIAVTVVEARTETGGQLRHASVNGVVYEPHGAHIFHTADEEVWQFVNGFLALNGYRHVVRTEVQGRELSWPPQLEELRELPEWPRIRDELERRPVAPRDTNFATWCTDLMGPTLYSWFVEPYSVKQWGCDPSVLSASFAPRRVDLREDGYRGLFRDPHQGFAPQGYGVLIDRLLAGADIALGAHVDVDTVERFLPHADARLLVTAPLDAYLRDVHGPLPWRGVRLESRYYPGADHVLSCGVVNHPGLDAAYTRRVETKWMTGQEIRGTVVSEEYPGTSDRHYPVDDAAGENRRLAATYQASAR